MTKMSWTRFGYRRARRHFTLAFIALAALLAFAPQALAQAMSTATVQASPAAATAGERVVLTATVTCPGAPDGGLGVTFFDGADLLATVEVGPAGQAVLATSFITTGSHLITAAYNGNDNCYASNNTTTVEVSDAPTPPTSPTSPTPPLGGLISLNYVANGNTSEANTNEGNTYIGNDHWNTSR
jgi:hypothetical protein